ncbi:MAG: hypothetical protein GY862_33835 [Gammaproteobacteria bacterium]|nr:hypothetical protein [Gammaproteobacteria bacterium]
MNSKSKRFHIRTTDEDATMFEQAAEQDGKSVSTWMHDNLRELAIKEIYGTGESEEFSVTPYQRAVLRTALMILQAVTADIPKEDKLAHAQKAERRIDAMVSGEKPPTRFS